jgi:phosphoserine phosphatase RsbU/P
VALHAKSVALVARDNPRREKTYNAHMADSPAQHMQCMEVWGGSQLTESGVELGGLDVWVYSKPFGEAQRGGDVYYVSSCATGRISRLLLADVSGHGQSVASTAADLRTLMRRFVNRLDQKEFVRLLNEQFTALSTHGNFATAVVTTFFEPSRRLSLCNAGHPRPLLYRVSTKKWSLLGHKDHDAQSPSPLSNVPLGMFDVAEYEQLDVELEPGDVLVSYTDALMESCDADGQMLGEAGLLRIANLLGDLPADKLIPELVREISERYPENLAADDVTLLVVRANGRKLQFSLREQIGALGRFLKSLVRPGDRAPFPEFTIPNLVGALTHSFGSRAPRDSAEK